MLSPKLDLTSITGRDCRRICSNERNLIPRAQAIAELHFPPEGIVDHRIRDVSQSGAHGD